MVGSNKKATLEVALNSLQNLFVEERHLMFFAL